MPNARRCTSRVAPSNLTCSILPSVSCMLCQVQKNKPVEKNVLVDPHQAETFVEHKSDSDDERPLAWLLATLPSLAVQ